MVFDLDGTIVFDGKAIEANLIAPLRLLQKKYRLIFASARPIRDMLPLLTDFDMSDLIGANGSMYRQDQELRLINYLSQKTTAEVFNLMERNDLDYIVDYDWHYSVKIRDSQNHILDKLDPSTLAQEVPLSRKQVTKIILFEVKPELAKAFQNLSQANVLYHESVEEIVITAKGIDKYNALKAMIGEQAYMAFGNDYNDITMLNHAQIAVCLGKILRSTNYWSMEPDGLADFLQYLSSL